MTETARYKRTALKQDDILKDSLKVYIARTRVCFRTKRVVSSSMLSQMRGSNDWMTRIALRLPRLPRYRQQCPSHPLEHST